MNAATPLLLSHRGAARFLGVGRSGTLSSLVKRGVITPVIVDGRAYFSRAQLEEFARTGESPAQPGSAKSARRRKVSTSIADIEI